MWNLAAAPRKISNINQVTNLIIIAIYATYLIGGGVVEIVNRKVEFSQSAEPKVNSLKNIKHQPQGGVVKVRQ